MSFTQGPYLDWDNNVQRINETLMNIWKLANSMSWRVLIVKQPIKSRWHCFYEHKRANVSGMSCSQISIVFVQWSKLENGPSFYWRLSVFQ